MCRSSTVLVANRVDGIQAGDDKIGRPDWPGGPFRTTGRSEGGGGH